MKYPSRSDYCLSIRNPQFAFRKKDPHTQLERDLDASLATGRPVERRKSDGTKDIWSASGSFAIAFKYETFSPTQKLWAIRCFYRSNFEVNHHYKKALNYLRNHPCCSYFVEFDFLEEGIRVQGGCYPVLKMEWVEGDNIKKFIKANLGKKHVLRSLAENWTKLSQDFLQAGIAHGDLQHGNVLIVNCFGRSEIKLIDYDSLYFSRDRQWVGDTIKGLSDYQHPLRKSLDNKCLEIDFFPQLVIYLSILALAEDKHLWEKYKLDQREGLLFTRADFESPESSNIFTSLAHLPDPIPELAYKLKRICQLKEFQKIPSLETVLSDKSWSELNHQHPISLPVVKDVHLPPSVNSLLGWFKNKTPFAADTPTLSFKESQATPSAVAATVSYLTEESDLREEIISPETELKISTQPVQESELLESLQQSSPVISHKKLDWDPRSYKATHPQTLSSVNSTHVSPTHPLIKSADEITTSVKKTTDHLLEGIHHAKQDLLQAYSTTRNDVADRFNQAMSNLVKPIPSMVDRLKHFYHEKTKIKTWTTAEVSAQLGCPANWCHRQRYQQADQFRIGVHYFKDGEGLIQWTQKGIKQLQRLRSQSKKDKIPPTTLPTKAVCDRLGVSSQWLFQTKAKHASDFVEGIHYHTDTRNRYYWTCTGIDQFQQFLRDRPPKSTPKKSKSSTQKKKRASKR
jgi:hypothetical protein